MKHIGILKPNTLVDLLNAIGIPVILAYLVSMFLVPAFQGGWSWEYIQNVWSRWQSLNAAMLALISSIAAFNISRFHANEQREREFSAAKAFLPEALDELCSYFRMSAVFLKQSWEDIEQNRRAEYEVFPPEAPRNYREVFSECIRHANPDAGDYLARILRLIQVHNARTRDLADSIRAGNGMITTRGNITTYMYRLAELQSLVNKLFPFARGMDAFHGEELQWEDFRNAYGNLNIWTDEHDDLEGFTKRAIERPSIL